MRRYLIPLTAATLTLTVPLVLCAGVVASVNAADTETP